MKIAVIKEGKVPPDRRVPLTPAQCAQIQASNDNVELVVETSDIRKFRDEEYNEVGVTVTNDLSQSEVLLGVKEVPISSLIDGKTYMFFSHTIKEQPYNRDLLRAILEKNIRLVDYEVVTNEKGHRLIGFGRYAGVVGCYNAFYAYGQRTGAYDLKRADDCEDRREMEGELDKVNLPSNFKIVLTGLGRVGKGAVEIIEKLGLREVSPEAYRTESFDEPVWTRLSVQEYNERLDGKPFQRQEFYADPSEYRSTFMDYARVSEVYIACHYWDARSPFIFTREDVRSDYWNVEVVADISCDIDGPVATTLRPSTIADPLYGYDPQSESEVAYNAQGCVTVMAVDNLPCELPRDASEDFGAEFINKVLPHFLNGDTEEVIARATITENGQLTDRYAYLQNYVDGVEVESEA